MGRRVCVRRECSPKLEIVVRRSPGSKGASSEGTRREKECSAPLCHHFTTLPPCHSATLPPLCHPATPEGRIERERAQIPDRSSVLLREPSRSVVLPLPNSLQHAYIRPAPNPLNQSLIYYLVPMGFWDCPLVLI